MAADSRFMGVATRPRRRGRSCDVPWVGYSVRVTALRAALHLAGVLSGLASSEIRSPAANVTVAALVHDLAVLPSILQVTPVSTPFLRTVRSYFRPDPGETA